MNDFSFELDETVKLKLSGEQGVIIGRAEYSESTNAYLVRYVAADGRQVEAWLNEAAIVDDIE